MYSVLHEFVLAPLMGACLFGAVIKVTLMRAKGGVGVGRCICESKEKEREAKTALPFAKREEKRGMFSPPCILLLHKVFCTDAAALSRS